MTIYQLVPFYALLKNFSCVGHEHTHVLVIHTNADSVRVCVRVFVKV